MNIPDLHKNLQAAQILMEEAIQAYGLAAEHTGRCMVAYRKSYGDTVKSLKEQGMAVSVIDKIAQGSTATLKGDLVEAEGKQRQAQMFVEAYKERIHSIKLLQRGIDNLAQSHNGIGQ